MELIRSTHSGRNKDSSRVDSEKQNNLASEIHVSIRVEVNPFGILRASDIIHFESGVGRANPEGEIVPAMTSLEEVIPEVGNAVLLT